MVGTAKNRKAPFATKDKLSKHDIFIRIFSTPNEQLDFMKLNVREEHFARKAEENEQDDLIVDENFDPSGDVTVTPSGEANIAPSGDVTVTPSGEVTLAPSGDVTVTPSGEWAVPRTRTSNSLSLFESFLTATGSGMPLQKWGYFQNQA